MYSGSEDAEAESHNLTASTAPVSGESELAAQKKLAHEPNAAGKPEHPVSRNAKKNKKRKMLRAMAPTSTASTAPVTSESEDPAVANHDLRTANHDLNASTAPVSSENEDAQVVSHDITASSAPVSSESEDAEAKSHKLIASIASTAPVSSVNEDAQVESDDDRRQLRQLRETHAKFVRGRGQILTKFGPHNPVLSDFDDFIKDIADEIAALM